MYREQYTFIGKLKLRPKPHNNGHTNSEQLKLVVTQTYLRADVPVDNQRNM